MTDLTFQETYFQIKTRPWAEQIQAELEPSLSLNTAVNAVSGQTTSRRKYNDIPLNSIKNTLI